MRGFPGARTSEALGHGTEVGPLAHARRGAAECIISGMVGRPVLNAAWARVGKRDPLSIDPVGTRSRAG